MWRHAWRLIAGDVDLAEHPVVVSVRTDPEPDQPIRDLDGQRAMMVTYACRPETVNLLEVKTWMPWVALEPSEGFVRELPDLLR